VEAASFAKIGMELGAIFGSEKGVDDDAAALAVRLYHMKGICGIGTMQLLKILFHHRFEIPPYEVIDGQFPLQIQSTCS
jgi:hypothetical protein